MSTAAAKYYCEINRNKSEYGSAAGWIANVLLSCRMPATRIKNLLNHLKAGREVATLSFTMPYNGFLVDGRAVRLEFLDKAGNKPEDFLLCS